jgi:hypothetical protein
VRLLIALDMVFSWSSGMSEYSSMDRPWSPTERARCTRQFGGVYLREELRWRLTEGSQSAIPEAAPTHSRSMKSMPSKLAVLTGPDHMWR